MTTRVAIYARISKDREGAGLGVERQRDDCAALAARLGWSVVGIYEDNDISAYSGKHRPGYRRLLDDIKAGNLDAVLAWHNDRLHRSPRELEEYIDVCEPRGIVTRTVQAGDLDLSTATGRAIARTLGAWARQESEAKSERIRRQKAQAAAMGLHRGGVRAFGWEPGNMELREEEAQVIRDATRDLLDGRSLGAIVKELNERGVTTSTGKDWNKTKFRNVLLRARNAGLVEHEGEIVGPAQWPAIVDEETWRALVSFLGDPSRLTHDGNTRTARYLLSHIAKCSVCGAHCVVASAHQGVRYYRCATTANHVGRNQVPVDELVLRTVAERLAEPDAADLLFEPEDTGAVETARARAQVLREREDELAVAFAEGEMTARQVGVASAKIQADLAAAEAVLTAAAERSGLGWLATAPDPAEAFLNATLDRQRAIIHALVTVTIRPAPRGKPKGWKPGKQIVDPKYVDIQFK